MKKRKHDQLRPIKIKINYIKHTPSVLIEMGSTRVICAASIDENVPRWLKGKDQGWVTGEYSMLPFATHERKAREVSRGKLSGRTMEIQRLIGRSLRGIINLKALGERTIWIDCDVISADGGTRTASISGGYIALALAIKKLIKEKKIIKNPLREGIGAISVGLVKGKPTLDLNYEQDVAADVDMNVVMTESGKFIEIQGTAEHAPFSDDELKELLQLARDGIKKIIQKQKEVIKSTRP